MARPKGARFIMLSFRIRVSSIPNPRIKSGGIHKLHKECVFLYSRARNRVKFGEFWKKFSIKLFTSRFFCAIIVCGGERGFILSAIKNG